MKKRVLLFSFIALCGLSGLQAQKEITPRRNQIDILSGVNIDLSHRTRSPASLLSEKSRMSGQIGMRYSHFFSKHWGGYTGVLFNFASTKYSNFYSDFAEPFKQKHYISNYIQFDDGGDGLSNMEFGVTYRIDNKRFGMRSRVGITTSHIRNSTLKFDLKTIGTNELYQISYGPEEYYVALMPYLSLGASAHYKLHERIYLTIDVNYLQPLMNYAFDYEKEDCYTNETIERASYKKKGLGRCLYLSVGLSFPIFKK